MEKLRKILNVGCLLFIFTAVSCGNKSGTAAKGVITIKSFEGNVSLGPLGGSSINVYKVLESGELDTTPIFTTTTSEDNGNYSLNLNGVTIPRGPIAIVATGGNYIEEGDGSAVSLGENSIVSLLPDAYFVSDLTISVTPLTWIAYLDFKAQIAQGIPEGKTLEDMANDSNYKVAQAFGLEDIIGVVPESPFAEITDSISGQYTLALAALSKAAIDAGTDSLAMTKAYAANFQTSGTISASAATVTNAAGVSVTITPPSMSALNTIASNIGSGVTTLPNVTTPTAYTALVMTSTPPTAAPSGYVAGNSSSGSSRPTPSTVCNPSLTSISISSLSVISLTGRGMDCMTLAKITAPNSSVTNLTISNLTATGASLSLQSNLTLNSGDKVTLTLQ